MKMDTVLFAVVVVFLSCIVAVRAEIPQHVTPQADPAAIVSCSSTVRITVLTTKVIRLERVPLVRYLFMLFYCTHRRARRRRCRRCCNRRHRLPPLPPPGYRLAPGLGITLCLTLPLHRCNASEHRRGRISQRFSPNLCPITSRRREPAGQL